MEASVSVHNWLFSDMGDDSKELRKPIEMDYLQLEIAFTICRKPHLIIGQETEN